MKAVKVCIIAASAVMVLSKNALAVDINFGPEIDPTSIASAVTLFMGSVMLLTAKRRK